MTTLELITAEDCEIEIIASYDDTPVRGNASAWDEETDRKAEEEILSRLNRGDVWAWANVRVRATWGPYSASDCLGCCSYADEADFKTGGYYDDMVSSVVADLSAQIQADQSGEH